MRKHSESNAEGAQLDDEGESVSAQKLLPIPVNDATLAFPGSIQHLMPPKSAITEYRRGWGADLFNAWFFCGLKKLDLKPQEGIDKDQALRHIGAIMGSFEPKHEDKEAACSYLFEHWFEPSSTWERKESQIGY